MTRRFADVSRPRDDWTAIDAFLMSLCAGVICCGIFGAMLLIFMVHPR